MMRPLNIAYYKKEDWDKFLDMVDDRENLHDNWEEWHKTFLKTKKDLEAEGLFLKVVEVDLEELRIYCHMRSIKIDGNARSRFVAKK